MIQGKKVVLRPATKSDKRMAHEWMNESDITHHMMGPPTFPDNLPATWEEFCADWKPYYFDDFQPELGRCFIITVEDTPIGAVAYNDIDEQSRRVEIDIWMSCEANCGKGYGPDALRTLCDYLFQIYHVHECWIQPSARNPRAVRAYEKAGFHHKDISPEEMALEYGQRDYTDSVLMIMRAPLGGSVTAT